MVEPTIFGLRGISPALDLIEDVWSLHNPGLDFAGVVLNRVPAISNDAETRRDELYKMVGKRAVWTPEIPHRVLVNRVHGERSPIHAFGAEGRELAGVFDKLLARLRRNID